MSTADQIKEAAAAGTSEGALSAASQTEPRNDPMSLAAALAALDPENDEHWTTAGKPAMAAVEALMGDVSITRAQVEDAYPDFSREAARGSAEPAAAGVIPEPGTNGSDHAEAGEDDPEPARDGNYQGLADAPRDNAVAGLEARIAALEADLTYLRRLFGWPTNSQ